MKIEPIVSRYLETTINTCLNLEFIELNLLNLLNEFKVLLQSSRVKVGSSEYSKARLRC